MHTKKNTLDAFESREMNTEEMIAFLEHLNHCDFCLEQTILHTEQTPGAQAPAYLKEQILNKASSPEVQAAKMVSVTSYKLQMLYYGFRTAVCVAATLLFLFGASQIDLPMLRSSPAVRTEAEDKITSHQERGDHLYNFSQNLSSGLSDSSKKLAGFLTDFSNNIVNGGK